MTATVIIPVTGTPECVTAINSVLNQTHPTTCYVVCDGQKYLDKVSKLISDEQWNKNPNFNFCCLPINVGANGFYGHRTYAAFTHLVDTKYVLYLDQDCWLEPNHVKICIDRIEKDNLDWSYSLRNVYSKDNEFICQDNCESLGKYKSYHGINHIDTNCYCLRTDHAIRLASVWHGGWGQDRVWFNVLSQAFSDYNCTGNYTVNYRVDGGQGSVTSDFFINGNKIMNEKYNGNFPWKR